MLSRIVLHANSFTFRTFTCKQASMSNSVQRCIKNGVCNFIETTKLKPCKVDGAPLAFKQEWSKLNNTVQCIANTYSLASVEVWRVSYSFSFSAEHLRQNKDAHTKCHLV